MTVAQKRQTRITERPIWRVREDERISADDQVTVEEPLEIRVEEESVAVIMRTPRHDFELAAGFLLTEGLIKAPRELGAISYCTAAEPPNEENIVEVKMAAGVDFDLAKLKRNFYASSSCGVCGKASIEAISAQAPALVGDFTVAAEMLYGLSDRMRQAQDVFEQTGSLHAAALFDRQGELLVLREDVGRHNAVDKLVGHYALRNQAVPPESVLMVSGRTSFEIVQKALMARIAVVCAVSAPSSLAVDMARETGMTLVGFLRGRGFNAYAGDERIEF
ncbi:formate dehydrogenase accessory sulfurtransferase FdhD [bacterium]|nr:formate dehydrogenase accessory sulfurtransferase FdhD [bacterium]